MTAGTTIRRNGKAEMAALQGVDVWWESEGCRPQRLTRDEARDLDAVQAAAGMDWQIGRSRVRYGEGVGQLTWDDHHVLFRKDTKAPLGLVSPAYRVVQPRQILETFADVVQLGGAHIETAGTLFGGRRFWALARIDGAEAAIGSGDVVRGYLLAVTSADGSLKTTLTETTVCVVCNNTVQMALAERGARVAIGHRTELTAARLTQLKERLAQTGKHFGAFMEAGRALAKAKIAAADARTFVETLLRDQKLISAADPERSTGYRKVLELFNGAQLGGRLASRNGTLWGLVNAVTEYSDHHVKTDNPSLKIDNAWFGRGDALKSAALAKALALV